MFEVATLISFTVFKELARFIMSLRSVALQILPYIDFITFNVLSLGIDFSQLRDIDVHSEVDREIDLHPEMGREIDMPPKLDASQLLWQTGGKTVFGS